MCQSQSLSPTSLLHSLVSLCSLDHPLLVFRTFPTLLSANLSPDAWTFTPAASGVHLPVSSPRASAFPKMVAGRLSAKLRTTPSVRDRDFGAVSHSLMFRPPGLLATQVVPTDATCAHGGHDFYFRAPYGSLLPHTSDTVEVEIYSNLRTTEKCDKFAS